MGSADFDTAIATTNARGWAIITACHGHTTAELQHDNAELPVIQSSLWKILCSCNYVFFYSNYVLYYHHLQEEYKEVVHG
jgi:hypothetical protein